MKTKQEKREYNRIYYGKHKTKMDEQHKNWYNNNKEHMLEYHANNRINSNIKTKENRIVNRIIALQLCSNGNMRCAKCGYDDINALDIDHINNDGNINKKNNNKQIYHYIIKTDLSNYQVLCRNCNWLKHLDFQDKKK